MKIQEVKDIIANLAKSVGSYGRLQEQLDEGNKWIEFTGRINQANCKDAVDVVLFLEQ